MNSENNYINQLIDINAVLKGHFILSSGLHSDTYIQCAKIFESPKIAEDLCRDLATKIRNKITSKIDYVVARFYKDKGPLAVLKADPDLITAEVKYEDATSTPELGLFPHVYGPLNTSAVVEVSELKYQ